MPLSVGNRTSGLTKAIYDVMKAKMNPKLPPDLKPADRAAIEEGWENLANSIAQGVVAHLTAHAEPVTDGASDAAYWQWLASLADALEGWATGGGDVANLRTRLVAHRNARPRPSRARGRLA